MIPHRGPFHAPRPYALVSTPSTTVSTQRMYLAVSSRMVTDDTGEPDALRERPPPSAPDSDTGAMPPWPSGLEIQQIEMPQSHIFRSQTVTFVMPRFRGRAPATRIESHRAYKSVKIPSIAATRFTEHVNREVRL